MQIQVLGDLEVRVAGDAVDLGGPKPRALLALLVAAGGRPVPVEQLIDQMWGEEPPARVEASLQSYVARLRRVLEPDRNPRSPARRLRTHAGGYSLDLTDVDVDARRFAELVRNARATATTDPGGADEGLRAALAMWHGEPYAGYDSPSLRAEATRLDELRTGAVGDLWELRLAGGEHPEAVAELEQLVRLYPLQERLWGLLALALYRSARQGDALAALRRARDHLADELGVDPGPELRHLEEQVLRQDPALDRAVVSTPAPEPAPAAGPGPASPGLPGREDALAAVDEALTEAAAGRGGVVLVTGEPGIGKTRLAEAVVDLARERGLRTGWGGWDADAAPALHGWTHALRELLGRDVLTDGSTGPAGDAAAASYQQADLVLDALDDGKPSLLVLDDAHWADHESLRLLRRIAGQLGRRPVLLLVTTRRAVAEIDDTWAEVLATIARLGPLRLDLAGLTAADVASWVSAQAGRDVPDEVAGELVRRTDGNPFFVSELVRLLVREGSLLDLAAEAWRAVPGGVRDVVRQRSRLLSAPAADLLASAAVVGRSVDLAVLDVLGRSAESDVDLAEAIEDAQVLGLVEEDGPGRVRFTHALVRDALYESLPAPVRVRRHAEVGAALETTYAGRIAEHAAELAEHYRQAGPAHVRSAWVFARRASDVAAEQAAYDESARLARLAVELQGDDPTVIVTEREDALVAQARSLNRISRPIEAWPPAERACRSALDRGDAAAAAACLCEVTDGLGWGWRTDAAYDDDAIALWRRVLDLQPEDAVLTRAHLTAGLAFEHLQRPGDSTESTRLADEAVAMVRRAGRTGAEELPVLRLAQQALLRPELLHHRIPLADEIVEAAARAGTPHDLAAALVGRAQERGELGRFEDARSDLVRALELATHHHLPEVKVIGGWSEAVLLLLAGDLEGSRQATDANEQLQASLAVSGEGIAVAHRVFLSDVQGRLPELEPQLRQLRLFHPALLEVHALSMVRADRLDELRSMLGGWSEQQPVLRDYQFLLMSSVRAETWLALGDQAAAADLYADLLPFADRLAMTMPVGFRGSMRLTLGRLAAALDDDDAAREHLERARARHDELGLPYWVEVAESELAAL
ncbi:AfsR/SARP family transcriptional regulator [Nocardioides sp. SR21]|uniref:AfsR/SARP family transcriptional regulator n=1 Tax=Nocardioides sp. SR21 TaxID=2919501 RepID=UPI001FAAF8E3|nr:AfsR/SARP family transcriptional regulator [Nocardioides sp. SR21]